MEKQLIKCQYCGTDVTPDKEKFCVQNKEFWGEWFTEFHKKLDKAVAIFMQETSKVSHTKLPSETSLMEFISWSHIKTKQGRK